MEGSTAVLTAHTECKHTSCVWAVSTYYRALKSSGIAVDPQDDSCLTAYRMPVVSVSKRQRPACVAVRLQADSIPWDTCRVATTRVHYPPVLSHPILHAWKSVETL